MWTRLAALLSMKRHVALVVALLASGATPLRAFYHLDVAIEYHATNGWRFTLYDLNYGHLALPENPVFVPWYSLFRIPSHPAYTNRLGAPDRFAWVIPETPVFGLPYLGLSAEGVASGLFVSNAIHLQLTRVAGPGHFSAYETDPFGNFVTWWNTHDGISTNEQHALHVGPGTHRHLNWAFSQAGRYAVHFRVKARFRGASEDVTSPEAIVLFEVEPPPAPTLKLAAATATAALTLTLDSIPTLPCTIESATNQNHWTSLTNFVPTGASTTFQLLNQGTRFYRAQLQVP